MKIVKICGGLGNQMFQYAFARSLAAAEEDEVYIDSSAFTSYKLHNGFELEKLFTLDLEQAPGDMVKQLSVQPDGFLNRIRRKYFTKPSHFIDRKFNYQPELFEFGGDRYFDGYWQSEKYFRGIEATIREGYRFRLPLAARNVELLESLPRPIASVHVRRGDYLLEKDLDICTPAYYERALAGLRASDVKSFIIFSDDIPYCRKMLRLGETHAAFVDWNLGDDSWQDMAMMSRCDHHVIANSSFSWWGAWLDPNPQKRVLAPTIWNGRQIENRNRYYRYNFDDVLPTEWERIPL